MRKAQVFYQGLLAGLLEETPAGYRFTYERAYLESEERIAISQTLPLQSAPSESNTLFSFFDGLIPEGWLLDIAAESWKLDPRDRMGLLLTCCQDCIGAVSIKNAEDE